uniref:Putative RNA-binding-like protein n=1 Tax=Phyllostachys edulis TaxID=38705 RepID=D3IVE6_PHYED|nr:putative RNA-binding-like protein [Phyllostachys edulis]
MRRSYLSAVGGRLPEGMARDLGSSDWPYGLLDWRVNTHHYASRRAPHPQGGDEATDLAVLNEADLLPLARMVETCVKVISEDAEKIPEAAPAPPASAQKDVTKKSYASVVKVMEGASPAPVAKPKPKPKQTVKGAENVDRSAFLTCKTCSQLILHLQVTRQGYSVFVKNLPFNATVEMVEEEFRKYGAIKPGGIQVRNRQPDRFCFGFLEFESQQSMQAAIEVCFILWLS